MPRITIEIPEDIAFEPSPAVRKGLDVHRMMFERNGDGLLLAVADFIESEQLDVSDAAAFRLLTVVKKITVPE
jgi:hypothetical protein